MIKKIIKLIIVIFIMSIIFLFSSDNGEVSSKKSDGVIIRGVELVIGRKLTNKEKKIYTEKYVVLVRGMAHFIIYFLLGIALISFLSEFNINNKILLYTMIFVFIYSISDEVHQLFSEGRSFELIDIIIDTIGGSVGSYIYYLFRRKKYE